MRQIIYMPLEPLFKRACSLREFGDNGELSWSELYEWNKQRTGMSGGEIEQAVWEALDIPNPARNGFIVQRVMDDAVLITDLEEAGVCDLTDDDDAHLRLPVEQFREWLYKWNADPLNRVMDTTEAAAYWGYKSADVVKHLCRDGTLKARKLMNGTYIIDRNQPRPFKK